MDFITYTNTYFKIDLRINFIQDDSKAIVKISRDDFMEYFGNENSDELSNSLYSPSRCYMNLPGVFPVYIQDTFKNFQS